MIKQLLPKYLPQIEKLCRHFYYPLFWNDDLDQKTEAYPQGNFVYEINRKVVAYIYSNPFLINKIISMPKKLVIPQNPNCYYIHDVCVDKYFHNKGIATKLIHYVINLNSSKFKVFSLVSVLNTYPFYEKLHFKIIKKITYNKQPAFYMARKI